MSQKGLSAYIRGPEEAYGSYRHAALAGVHLTGVHLRGCRAFIPINKPLGPLGCCVALSGDGPLLSRNVGQILQMPRRDPLDTQSIPLLIRFVLKWVWCGLTGLPGLLGSLSSWYQLQPPTVHS
jgi:hypothetical protein